MDDIGLELKEYWEKLRPIGLTYSQEITAEFQKLWGVTKITGSNYQVCEVAGALIARQVSLAANFAQDPLLWNVHFAPIIQRCFFEININLAWIFRDPIERSRQFIEFGLGAQKLYIEHLKINKDKYEDDIDALITAETEWLNMQKNPEFIPVDISGNWSGLGLRDMAIEVDMKDYYDFYYPRLSSAIHSNWHFIGKVNVSQCDNVMHRFHFVPKLAGIESNTSLLMITLGMLNMSFDLYQDNFMIDAEVGYAYQNAGTACKKLFNDKASAVPI